MLGTRIFYDIWVLEKILVPKEDIKLTQIHDITAEISFY